MNYCKNTYFFNTNFVKTMIVENCLKRFWGSKEKPAENRRVNGFFFKTCLNCILAIT